MTGSDQADANLPTVKMESAGVRTRKCMVYLLNGQEFQCNVEKNANGLQLLRQIRELLDIIEFDYFGLYFEDSAQQKYWLEPEKSIKKQLKNSPWKFHLSVKFYPSDPSQLTEDVSRYYMVLQLRDNIVSGSLPCSFVTHALLGSFVVQSELGDYDPTSMGGNYVAGFQFAPNQTRELEDKVIDLHKTHKGLTPEEAEVAFLENAKKLPQYGVDQHIVKDSENVELVLGVSWNGLRVYRDQILINRFAWPRILKISYTRNKYYIKIRPVDDQIAESIVGFKLPNHRAAKRLWKSSVEHHTFFRLTKPEPARPKLVRTGSRFRYSGQTQYQTRQTAATSTRKNVPKIQRTASRRSYRGQLGSDSPAPPEIPKKQSSVTTTQVITTITEEVETEEVKTTSQKVPDSEDFEVISDKEIAEAQAMEKSLSRSSSSSSLSSSSDEEGMDALTKHQKKVLKMKPQNENDEKNSEDGKFLQEPLPGSTGSSEWDIRLQSSPAKNAAVASNKELEKSDANEEPEAEITEVAKTIVTEIMNEVMTQEKNKEVETKSSSEEEQENDPDENKPDLVEAAAAVEQMRRLSTSSSSSDEFSTEESPRELEIEAIVHVERQESEITLQSPSHEAAHDEIQEDIGEVEEELEKPDIVEEPPMRRDSSSSSSTDSSKSDEEEKEEPKEDSSKDEEPGNENNNNNEGSVPDEDEVTHNVITTVETKSVRVEDVVIPREDNEIRKVALTADEDNNVMITETRSTSSKSSTSSSSSLSSDSEDEMPVTEDPPVINGFKKPPIVETEVAYVEPTEEEKPAVTTEPPVVRTETKTITYESTKQSPDEDQPSTEVQLLSSQTITAETMSSVTTTHITKTVEGSFSETRVEKSIVITADGDTDMHQAMAEAIRDTQVDNPDVNITKVIVHEETAVENPK